MIAGRGTRQALRQAQQTLESVSANSASNTFRSACANAAADLRQLRSAIDDIVREDVAAYWDSARTRAPDVRGVSREAAVLLLASDRHEGGIRRSIERFLHYSGHSGEELVEALFTARRRHRVACVVDGTEELRHLSDLRPDAKQFRLGVEVSGWGLVNDRLEAFAARMDKARPGGPHQRPACLVSVDIDAPDWEAAASIGRRIVSEMLDHYVAGHRLVDLTLRADVLVNDIQRRGAQWRSNSPKAVREAYPLSKEWPASLSEAMRMAHIARTTDSPMAAAALSWSSIEAAGLSTNRLSGALALQTFRHRLVQSHGEVVTSLGATAKANDIAATAASRKAEALRRTTQGLPAGHPGRAEVVEKLFEAEAIATGARDRRDRHRQAVTALLDVIRAHVTWTDRGYLVNLDTWVDLLRPARASDADTARDARTALSGLLPELSPAAAELVDLWRARFARPSRCARWLEDMKRRYEWELNWLYATRNLTVHSGQLTVHGDVQLASVASGLADLTLEFLGSWYAIAALNKPQSASDSPVQVTATLDDRCLALVDHLRARHALSRMHAEHLTSCTSNGWDR